MFGTVTAIIRKKGFGYIKDAEGQERFFHANNLRGISFEDLLEGTDVEFVAVHIPDGKGNGLRAEAVTVHDHAA